MFCRLVLLPLLMVLLLPGGASEPPNADAIKSFLPDRPGWFHWVPPPGPATDPLAADAAADSAWISEAPGGSKLTTALATFIDGQAARVAAHARTAGADADFLAWLAEPAQRALGSRSRPIDLYREFLLALDWRYDRIAAACSVLDRLRRERPQAVSAMPHLAIAIAVVYDDPNLLYGSRYHGIGGWEASQFPPLPDAIEVLDHFDAPAHQAALAFKPADLVWPMLVHVVDLDTTPAERTWALSQRRAEARDPAPWYKMCPYDYDKLGGKGPRLGTKPYSLENLLAFGGVCGDQAHFMTRTAKTFGIPAMKCTGMGRYGGGGHAWAGFLTAQGGLPTLAFTGRYFYDHYYTGDVFDPQTGRLMLDRYVHLLYDAVAEHGRRGTSYARWVEARALTRTGLALESADPERSLQLATLAIARNPCLADAWRLAFRHVAAGRVDEREVRRLGKLMTTTLADHPDLTVELIDHYLAAIPADQRKERDQIYNGLWGLYAKRPDLQIRVRRQHCAELVAVGQEPRALELALHCVVANAGEGTLIMPLVEYVVETSRTYATAHPSFNVAVLRAQMDKASAAFPKKRGSRTSPAWTEFEQLRAQLP